MKHRIRALLSFIFRDKRPVALSAIWLVIIGDIIFGDIQSDIVFFGMLGFYLMAIIFYKLNSKATFSFCFFFLGLMFIMFIFSGVSEHTEKAAVWLFLFMGTGIFQELVLDKR